MFEDNYDADQHDPHITNDLKIGDLVRWNDEKSEFSGIYEITRIQGDIVTIHSSSLKATVVAKEQVIKGKLIQ